MKPYKEKDFSHSALHGKYAGISDGANHIPQRSVTMWLDVDRGGKMEFVGEASRLI